MVNRVMAQKRAKMVRQRRAWAKVLVRRGYQAPNREVVQEYAKRARGLALFDDGADVVAEHLLPGKQEIKQKQREKLQKQAELEARMPPGCDQRVLGPSGRDCNQESWIYSNSQKNCFVLVHVDHTTGTERMSQAHSSIDILMMHWSGGAIRWVSTKKS